MIIWSFCQKKKGLFKEIKYNFLTKKKEMRNVTSSTREWVGSSTSPFNGTKNYKAYQNS